MAGSGSQSITLNFYILGNVNVDVATKYYVQTATADNTFTLNLGQSTLFSTKVSFWGKETKEGTVSSTMTSSNSYVKCNNSYGLSSAHSKVYYVKINYR